jgi:hypothetical protein
MLLKNETPVKSQTMSKPPQYNDDDTMKYNAEEDFTLNKRQSSGYKRISSSNKENAIASPNKTPNKTMQKSSRNKQVQNKN